MTPLESVFYMVWRGLAVGVLISAPMGPVGILCIQRTLDRGRKAGFSTGIGAALSDLFYCLLTGFGLSFIEDFLQENSNVIQLFGSLVLIAFSIYLFKKNPSSSLRRPVPQNVSVKKNILGGFLFTFSNPLIIFLIIGLFARFNFTAPEIQGGFYAIGYVFIIAGALGWWYGVTYLIDKVRTRFNMRSMKRLNVAIGIVILAFACVGIVSSILGLTSSEANAATAGAPSVSASSMCRISLQPDGMSAEGEWLLSAEMAPAGEALASLDLMAAGEVAAVDEEKLKDVASDGISEWELSFRLADVNAHPGRKYRYLAENGEVGKVNSPGWLLLIEDARGDTLELRFRPAESDASPISTERVLTYEVSRKGDSLYKGEWTRDVDTHSGWNAFRIGWSPWRGLTLRATSTGKGRPVEMPLPEEMLQGVRSIALRPMPGGCVRVKYPVMSLPYAPSSRSSEMSASDLSEQFRWSNDPVEGEWQLLDYSMEESRVKLGGAYRLAIVRAPSGRYDVIYLGGAAVNGDAWSRGMIKGTLHPTGLSGIYDAEWRDTDGRTLPIRMTAQLEGDLITIHIPDTDSRFRLARLPGIH